MLREAFARSLTDPAVFRVGTDPFINFCQQASQVLGIDNVCDNYQIHAHAEYDMDQDQLPEQYRSLFGDATFSAADPLVLDLSREVGRYGRWVITYDATPNDAYGTPAAAEQIMEIQYPCLEADITLSKPLAFTADLAAFSAE